MLYTIYIIHYTIYIIHYTPYDTILHYTILHFCLGTEPPDLIWHGPNLPARLPSVSVLRAELGLLGHRHQAPFVLFVLADGATVKRNGATVTQR